MFARVAAAALCLLPCWPCTAQTAPPAGGQDEARAVPANPAEWDAPTILAKTFSTYTSARTYQADWLFTQEGGGARQQVVMQVKSKAPDRLFLHVGPAPGAKPDKDTPAVPVMTVVADGRTAWFQNNSEKVYYRITMPAGAKLSPMAFFPQIRAVQSAKRAPDVVVDGKPHFVLEAVSPETGTVRVDIDAATLRIRRMVSTRSVGTVPVTATLLVTKETFDKDLPESTFGFKAMAGGREIPPPTGAGAVLGLPEGKPAAPKP